MRNYKNGRIYFCRFFYKKPLAFSLYPLANG